MPKMKTHKGANKRIKVTNGAEPKVMRMVRVMGKQIKAGTKTKRQTRKMTEVKQQDKRPLKRLLPGL